MNDFHFFTQSKLAAPSANLPALPADYCQR